MYGAGNRCVADPASQEANLASMMAEALDEMERLSAEAVQLAKIVFELAPGDAKARRRKGRRKDGRGGRSKATSVASSIASTPQRSMPSSLTSSPSARANFAASPPPLS